MTSHTRSEATRTRRSLQRTTLSLSSVGNFMNNSKNIISRSGGHSSSDLLTLLVTQAMVQGDEEMQNESIKA